MSDIYDYTYMHVMRQPVQVNNYTTPPHTDDTKYGSQVNTDDFTPRDLQLFVDSMEAITRLERTKYERRQRRKIKYHQETFEHSKKIITCLDASLACTACDDDDAKTACSSDIDYIYDETYYGTPFKGASSETYSNIKTNPYKSFSSDSAESGVFCNNTDESHFYENIDIENIDIDPIRPRSNVISNPKCKSLKSRLISLIMKKQYVQPEAPIADILSSTTYGEDTEETEIYDRVVDEVIQQQFAKTPNKGKRKYQMSKKLPGSISPEEKFLDKAMRFLTL